MKNFRIVSPASLAFVSSVVCIALTALSCSPSHSGEGDFPVNETIAGQLIAKGAPEDIARFFAAAKFEATCPNDTTCVYRQTFPNSATREMTLVVDPNRKYTPTAEEVAKFAAGTTPIYAFEYKSSTEADGTTKVTMNYYLPAGSLKKTSNLLPKALKTTADTGGVGIAWTEIAKTGFDVSIGSLLDYAKDKGLNVGSLSVIYALASALSNISTAMDISKQNTTWLSELDALEKCAANPTNPTAKSDPNYSRDTVAKIRAARSELQQVAGVRFLNIMTETGSGITPVTAVLSVGMKQGFVWSEQTLTDYSEETIMREARLAVVKCTNETTHGNIDVRWECTIPGQFTSTHEIVHTVTNASWVYDPASRMYVSQGSYTYESVKTSTGGGKTCTYKKTGGGDIGQTGRLMVIDDLALQKALGFGYSASGQIEAQVAATEDCSGYAQTIPETIEWLPNVTGYPGAGGSMDGVRTSPSCVGTGASGTQTIVYSFSVPPAK